MNKKLFSEDFKNDLERMMGLDIKRITEDDLYKIKRIKLTPNRIDGTLKQYNFEDLNYLKNLRLIIFDQFHFNGDDIEKIEKNSSLAFIHFDFCDFQTNRFNFNDNVNFVMFDNCKSLDVNMLSGTKVNSLKIVGSVLNPKEIDMSDMGYSEFLNELSMNNFNIRHASSILKTAPNLNVLNFDGSIVEDYSSLNPLNIKISNRDKYLDGIVD